MIINLKSQTDLSGFYIVYEGSTNLEKPGLFGTSHLMEHLVCKSFEHLREDFEKEGIDWNAYTSSNEIVFYFTGLDEYLNPRKQQLVELMSEFKITKQDFEKERGIVLEEYSDYFGDQTESHALNLNRKLFRDYDPIGLKEDLQSLKYMDCIKFWELQFANPTKIINVSPKNIFKTDIEFANRTFDRKLEFGPHKDIILEKRNDFGDKASLIMVSPLAEEDFNYISFINAMLSSGLSSPLYQEVREKKGLVYHISCSQARNNKQGFTTISTQTGKKNIQKVYDTVRKVINNPDKYLTKSRFETIKESYLIKLKKDKINRFSNVNQWILPKGWSIKEIIKTVTLNKIRDVYEKYYNFDNFYLSYDAEEFK
jgi:predicted Zn-dependent peptidase